MAGKFISDEQRDHVIMLANAGIPQQEIASIMGFGLTTVNNMINVANAVKEENWEKLSKLKDSIPSKVVFDWALTKYKKTEPKPVPVKEEPLSNDAVFVKMIKEACSEAIEESCKCNIEQIDKDQMGRLMFALGQITSHLEVVSEKLDAILKAWS